MILQYTRHVYETKMLLMTTKTNKDKNLKSQYTLMFRWTNTVLVWLLFVYPYLKYCTLYVRGVEITGKQTDRQTKQKLN